MDRRRVPVATAVLVAAAILAVTLATGNGNAARSPYAGGAGWQLADLARNLILFAPLGASLAWTRLSPGSALLLAVAFSASIELAQAVIPGRYSDPLDCVANAAGAGLGIALVVTAPAWLRPSPARRRRLVVVAGAIAAAVLAGTGILLAPSPSAAIFYGHHAPSLAHLAPYRGSVLHASIDGIAIPPFGTIADSEAIRARLRGDYSLRVDALAGSPPRDLAAFVMIADATQTENLLLGPDREDLVYRFRSRGQPLGLATATVRLPGALHRVHTGDRLLLEVQRSRADLCFRVGSAADCGHGFTVGDGWMLIAPDSRILHRWRPIVAAAWLAALFAPLGYWAGWNAATAAAWALAAIALLVPPAAALLATPASQIASAACGTAFGVACRRHFAALPDRPRQGTR